MYAVHIFIYFFICTIFIVIVYKRFILDLVDIIIKLISVYITIISKYVTYVLMFHNNTIFDSHKIGLSVTAPSPPSQHNPYRRYRSSLVRS